MTHDAVIHKDTKPQRFLFVYCSLLANYANVDKDGYILIISRHMKLTVNIKIFYREDKL
jgi:hypothetical protein